MHEIGIVKGMCRTVLDYAKEHGVNEISEIVCEVGELSLVVPEYVEKLYPLVAEGTPLEKTKLTLQMVPGMARCDECGEIFDVIETEGYCPSCNSFDKTVLTGVDFNIKEIHVIEEGCAEEDPDN